MFSCWVCSKSQIDRCNKKFFNITAEKRLPIVNFRNDVKLRIMTFDNADFQNDEIYRQDFCISLINLWISEIY